MLMNRSAKYKSIQELKSSSRLADPSSTKSMNLHDSFERSLKALRQEYINQKKQVNES
ncbi:hypothetical protein DYBT9623_00737 [Dyadobacter sp. CECT 9623]|uniref:Uncharacterized protein n=1 Tax=Dyadobacter linearis TaxID=2823330 RepID=A0ABN7R7C5_9BACT|nr:hypothetical protein DYBT9623_00737 [Dyadobacter sp. CECT 9623]